jgi:hypothetical protein
VKIGKYAYPLHHPSFFDQPLFESIKMGSFHLQQIAGVLNAKLHHDLEDGEEDTTVELFTKEDLMSKRYLLTSYPLPNTRQRRQRWSIKYNAFVGMYPIERGSFYLYTVYKVQQLNSLSLTHPIHPSLW